jgi:hypothetical protein
MIPSQTRNAIPPFTTPAPIRPPIRAWEELLGRPNHQVSRFQAIAPPSAERIRVLSMMTGLTMPVPMVFATGAPIMKAARKLNVAAQ